MSVQAGTLDLDGQPASHDVLARIGVAVAEYAPDSQASRFDGPLGMLYRPFHTTLESRAEHQPHVCGRQIITWDGRLDNRDDLRAKLDDGSTGDGSDVAIVAASFRQWGCGCFAQLVGDWALAIWDPLQKELILARDFMGIRPLFYYHRANRTLWCSHLAPLANCGEGFTLCEDYIAGYFAFHPEADITPYREIRSVPPGGYVCVRPGTLSVHHYWSFNPKTEFRYKNDTEYEEQYRHLFRQAVKRRLRTDSPVLAELSGGLDSTSIICMADDISAKENAQAPTVNTFSYYDSLEPGEDDFTHLAKVEEWRGKRGFHSDLHGSGDSFRFEYPTFTATPGFGARSEIKSALSSAIQQHKYRVMLCGTGGDELNGQPLDPCVQMADLLAHFRLRQLGQLFMAWSPRMRRPLNQLVFQVLLQFFPAAIRARLTDAGRLEPWIDRSFAKRNKLPVRQIEALHASHFLLPGARDAAQTIATLRRQLTNSSPSFCEKRYPYLDQNLVEYLTGIPLDQLLRPGERRSLMRRSLRHILPPAILARRTKTGAGRCYSLTLQKHWAEVDRIFSSLLISNLGFVDREKTYAALLAMKNGQIPTYFLRLLKALSLELWLRDADERGVLSIRQVASFDPRSNSARFTSLGTRRIAGD